MSNGSGRKLLEPFSKLKAGGFRMANSQRLRKNRDGKIFIPMNVEGGGQEQSFFNTSKLVTIVVLIVVAVLIFSFLSSSKATLQGYIIVIGMMVYTYQLVIRYVIFEEKYYYGVYKKTKMYKNPTPAIFWDIASFRDREDGTLIIYSDMKVGVLVKLERDTIVGKDESFVEEHFDALSEFYKEVNLRKLNFVQLNLMEQAGKDNRISHLDRLVSNAKNENIAKILELQLGHIKNITRETLYETDYILLYTTRVDAADYLLNDVMECLYKLMDGAYNGFEIMHSKDIKEMPKDLYYVNYFDYVEATTNLFKQSGMTIPKAFDLDEIRFDDGTSIKIGNREKMLLQNLASCIENGTLKSGEWTIKEALEGKFNMNFKINMDSKGIKNSEQTDSLKDITETQNDTEGDVIIDLDNEAFGGEYGIGMNTIKVDNNIIEQDEEPKEKRRVFKLGKRDK